MIVLRIKHGAYHHENHYVYTIVHGANKGSRYVSRHFLGHKVIVPNMRVLKYSSKKLGAHLSFAQVKKIARL